MAAAFAAIAMPSHDRRFTADWAQENERRAAGQEPERQLMTNYYARLTKDQEERDNAEARERFAESQQETATSVMNSRRFMSAPRTRHQVR
jgi:hypothetical protein